jgi:hypothetical protein
MQAAARPVANSIDLAQLGECVAGAGCQMEQVQLRGVDVHCVVDVDQSEHLRRREAQVGSIRDRDLLDALVGLTPGVRVPRREIRQEFLRVLHRDVAAAVELDRAGVVRLARVPLIVDLAVVVDAQWRRGLNRASRFGPYCRRVLAMSRLPADPTEFLLAAAYFGVGVWAADVQTADGDALVVPPAPFVPERFTAAAWAFAEDAYRQILHPRTVPHAQSRDHDSKTAGNGTLLDI